jgi:hypothetical protein
VWSTVPVLIYIECFSVKLNCTYISFPFVGHHNRPEGYPWETHPSVTTGSCESGPEYDEAVIIDGHPTQNREGDLLVK